MINRRSFISRSAALGAAVTFGLPALADQPDNQDTALPVKKIRVGLIGCGSVSGMYLPHLSKSPYAEVVSCCDRIVKRAETAASRYRIPNHYASIEAMLEGVPFDLLVNLTDMQEHGHLNRKALMAGRHVWSEKPMASSYAEAWSLLELARQKGLRIWGAPAVVTSPQFAFMSKALREGKIGRPAAAHATYGHTGPLWSSFFYEKNGGSMPDLGVYNLVTLTGIIGPARSVVAMTSIVTPVRNIDEKGEIRVEAEDNAIILLDHGNGVLSHVQCGFNYFDPHGHEGKGQERPSVSIVGTGGSMHLVGYDWAPGGVDLATVEKPEFERFAKDTEGYVWEQGASYICECMATGKEPLITAEHALHIVEVMEAARESQETGRRVYLKSTFRWPVV